jgi:hypothetical protein
MESVNGTNIETVLRNYGFTVVAGNINFRRRDQSHKLLILLSGNIAA